jgi:hypothetical protein
MGGELSLEGGARRYDSQRKGAWLAAQHIVEQCAA